MDRDFLLLDDKKDKARYAEYNIFKFQDHLLNWIFNSAKEFTEGNYIASFESLSVVYMDVLGFLTNEEIKKLKELYNVVEIEAKLINKKLAGKHSKTFQMDYGEMRKTIMDFRIGVMTYMAKHNLTMKTRGSSQFGTGGE